MRLFFAIRLPADERRAIGKAIAPLRAAAPAVAWTGEDRLHLTIKFLGDVEDARIPSLRAAAKEVASRQRPQSIQVGGLGAFPNLRSPKIIWLGIAGSAPLELLHHDLESSCAELGHEVEGRPFRPHLTLGRVKRPLDVSTARALAVAARTVTLRRSVPVRSVDLMASMLGERGRQYSVLAELPLGGA
ncbi:MAG: RNA 2',3'-cyclic phosphodiesterase [Gemmatimonadota bacterium]|nr:RNA 2',3'-cyclic phosphodiesterase [Gemmatimonadota bacterium]